MTTWNCTTVKFELKSSLRDAIAPLQEYCVWKSYTGRCDNLQKDCISPEETQTLNSALYTTAK